jgi:xylulokinase
MELLCIDIGTSSVKGAVIGIDGKLKSWNRVSLYTATGEDFAHWDADRWRKALGLLLDGLENHDRIDGIVVSGNGPTVVPIGSDGLPVFEALLWLDRREIRKPEVASLFLPKILWFAEEYPAIYEKTDSFLSCPEYIAFVLTGEKVTATPSTEFSSYIWTEEAIGRYGLDTDKFPPTVSITTAVGTVLPSIAEQFSFRGRIPVYVGGPDFLMSLLGTGVTIPGRTCDRAGTSEGINFCSPTPIHHPRLRTLPHVIEGYYNIAGILASTGRIFEWFRKISGQTEKSYVEMFREIKHTARDISEPRFFPSMHTGEVWEFTKGIFLGLGPHHETPSLGRAVVEAIGFAVRDHIGTLEQHGCTVDELRVSGGQARNTIWNQMKADITRKKVALPAIKDAELLGNACVGFTGESRFSSIKEASDELVCIQHVLTPNEEEAAFYDGAFERYMKVCNRIITMISEMGGSLLSE